MNTLIEASAGTGKTQELAEHLIALLRDGHRKPSEIVALTFSRAAAGEIFERFVTLLAKSAANNPKDAELLRSVISSQHLSQIGTLDSFLMRIVKAFPFELGLDGEIRIMDEYEQSRERSALSFSILRRTDARTKRDFADAFAMAMNREDVRSFVESYREFIKNWHERVANNPAERCWGDPTAIWGREPAFLKATEVELGLAADALIPLNDSPKWQEFVSFVRNFRGSFGSPKGIAAKILEIRDLFKSASVCFSFSRKNYEFKGEEARKIQWAIECIYGYVLKHRLALAKGVYNLISAFECEYSKRIRKRGQLVFSDIPRLIAKLPEAQRLQMEYRMDSRITDWALDEFQDTSREQWNAISNLIDEAKMSDGEKSLFIVGDVKQAIYGWRNGDVGIFRNERDSGCYEPRDLTKSWRYGSAITEAVNRVFVWGRLKTEFPAWNSPEHSTAKDFTGFVQLVEAMADDKLGFVEPIYNAIKAVDPVGRGMTAAILVRQNAFGELLVDELRRKGLTNIVWEGESDVLDTPALSGFLDLLQLAEHPGDALTYRHFIMTNVCKAKYPGEVPSASEISQEMSLKFTTRGLARTFLELRKLFPEDPDETWSKFTENRFTELVRAASEFELGMVAGTRLADFPKFLAAKKKRNLAEPGKIRVMTIHHSKGLGFDYVVLPLFEKKGMFSSKTGGIPLVGDGWIMPDPGKLPGSTMPVLADAWELRKDRIEQEALCTYYVAMTRAKQAMTIVLHPVPKGGSDTIRFSNLVRDAFKDPEIGDREWYLKFAAEETERPDPPVAPTRRQAREYISRRLPSKGYEEGGSAGKLFMPSRFRKQALEKGTQIHAEFEKVDFNDWILRPDGFTELWRERPFEVLVNGVWTSGRFDRVVFAAGRAVIQDFKTGHRVDPETYRGQMESYRRALASITGLKLTDIDCELLLTETKQIVRL